VSCRERDDGHDPCGRPIVIALAALGFAAWQQARGFRHAREMADLADVRALFDDAAVALHDASYALRLLQSGLLTYGASLSKRKPDALNDGQQTGERLRAIGWRLGVRLEEDHPALAAHASAYDATWEALRAVFAITPTHETEIRETVEVVKASHQRLLAATNDFMRAATETVGARLP
jgi:hypothetical protein